MLYWFGVVGLCTLGVDERGRASSFLNMLYWFGVVGLCTLGVNEQGRACLLVYASVHLGLISGGRPPHFSIGYTGLV